MQAVILVGGEGTRLRPLTYVTPKPMVPLFGVPFLEHTLVRLREAGVEEAILAAGYLPRAIEDYFGDGERVGIRLTYVVEPSPLGTAGALRNVASAIRGAFFVLNGDVLTSLDLRAMAAFHRARAGLGVLHTITVDDPSSFGCVVSDASGRISAFVEKPPRDEAPTNDINAGTYLLEPAVLDTIPPERNVSIERVTFPDLLAAGRPLYSFLTSDYWLDLGRPQQYLDAHRDVLDGRLALPAFENSDEPRGRFWRVGEPDVPANFHAPVFVGERVVVHPSATIGPYAVVGAGARIEAGAIVAGAILWDGVHIAPGASVRDAILASDVRVGEAAALDRGAVVGHGAAVDANATFDADARIEGARAASRATS